MNLREFNDYIYKIFDNEKLLSVKDEGEYGFTCKGRDEVKKIGYCTNLTPDVVEKANVAKVDLLLTHHDAWKFIVGMSEKCTELLKKYNISHYYIHGPLDDSEFGTSSALVEKLGAKVVDKFALEDGFYNGKIGELEEVITFEDLIKKCELIMEEPMKVWKNNSSVIKRIGVVTGAGFSSYYLNEAKEKNCDVYITGEKILYTVQYAELAELNLIVGSHTFTEIFGVENLALKIKAVFENIIIERIDEEHIE